MKFRFKVLCGNEVDKEVFSQMLELDKKCFSDEYSLSSEYISSLYKKSKEGLFCLIDKDKCVGYINCIFITEEQKQEYIGSGDFRKLNNIGPRIGNNILYIYTIALDENYRGTKALVMLLKRFSNWLLENKKRGINITYLFAEAVSDSGIKILKKMGMIPIDKHKLDDNCHGFYYSPDNLENYFKILKNKKVIKFPWKLIIILLLIIALVIILSI